MSGTIASIQTGQLSTDLYANAFTVLLAGIAPDPVTAAVWMRFLTSLEVEC